MNEDELDRLESLAQQATPTPWRGPMLRLVAEVCRLKSQFFRVGSANEEMERRKQK